MAERFASEFAGKKKGFSAREISEYFCQFSNLVKHVDYYGMVPVRHELFLESLYSLEPKQQYYALNDLTFFEHKSKNPYPDEPTREKLCEDLHTFISPNPIGLRISKLRETAFRVDWMESNRRISIDPPGAITAARTFLETTLKTILDERGETDASGGDIGKLVKQVEKMVGFEPSEHQGEHKILSGLASVLSGVVSLSNAAGDRHGTVGGVQIDDPAVVELCVNACGVVGLFLLELHLLSELKTEVKVESATGGAIRTPPKP